MRLRWRLVLPVVGLMLFSGETYHSLRIDREIHHDPSRYFWWSSLLLDSDPLNKRARFPTPCQSGTENCVSWDPRYIWVDPGWLARALELSAFPAFALGAVIVSGLARLGISEVASFMFAMPLLVFAWYYFLGWLIDRRRRNHPQQS